MTAVSPVEDNLRACRRDLAIYTGRPAGSPYLIRRSANTKNPKSLVACSSYQRVTVSANK